MAKESSETENIEFITNNNTSPFNSGEEPHRRHLLSTSTENGTRFTARKRRVSPVIIRVGMLVAFLLAVIVVTIILVVNLSGKQSFTEHGHLPTSLLMHEHCANVKPIPLATHHLLCSKESLLSTNCEQGGWIKSENGKVLISPNYTVSQQLCGLEISMKLYFTTEVDVNILINNRHHTTAIRANFSADTCTNIILKENLLKINDTFRAILRLPTEQIFQNVLHAHVSAYGCLPYNSIRQYSSAKTTFQPNFDKIQLGDVNLCTSELNNDRRTVHCDWWNLVKGDSNDFKRRANDKCINSGINLVGAELHFLSLTPIKGKDSRSILVSPIIERKSSAVLFEMWFLMKCIGPNIKIHLVPLQKPLLKSIEGENYLVANVTQPAKHSSWKHEFITLKLSEEYPSYQLAIDATIPSNVSCKGHYCTGGNTVIPATEGQIAIDDISIQLLHPTCNVTGPSVVDCTFQQKNGTDKTTCGWTSSTVLDLSTALYDYGDAFDDWRPVNSGDGELINHGATEQHFEDRGYIMTFDATGKADSESFIKTPKLRSNGDCSCTMRFLYLLRGVFTPRMIVNVVYNADGTKSSVDAQWSLYGHQSDNWEIANVVLNLHKGRTFEIEIRVMEVLDSKGDIHFDDVEFINCDFDLM